MSSGPDFELQKAIVATLSADVTLQGLLGNPLRLHQNVPPNPVFPYVTIGESQDLADIADCIDGSEIFMTFHVWSRAGGFNQAKTIGFAIHSVLQDADLTLESFRCVQIASDNNRFFFDQDNVTAHGVLTYRALVEPTE